MRDRLYTTEAIILRRSEVGEADRLLTIYTPTYGKLAVSARGVRKTSSKLAGHLELFLHTRLQLARGRTFDVVTESRVVQPMRRLREDLDRISWAYYVSELVDKMTPDGSENPALFRLLRDTMAAIDEIDGDVERDVLIRFYELHILVLSGYRPHLFHCAQCEAELGQDADRFSAQAGGVLCPRCAQLDPLAVPMTFGAFKLLRYLARSTGAEARALAPSAATLLESGRLLKLAMRQILERELKSVVFLDLLRS
jgi:DNA repair protein RecO (recombination protein O)